MQGAIAQIAALVIQGNAYFRDPEHTPAFPDAHSTLTFCEFVKFVELTPVSKGWSESPYANDPASWLEKLRKSGFHAIRMIYIPGGQNQGGAPDRNHW